MKGMSMSRFEAPAPASSGDSFPVAEAHNHALIIKPTEHIASMTTVHGESAAIKVDVVDLTTGIYHGDVLWFPKVIVGTLSGQVGKLVLAMVGQGEAKPGKSAPWVLQSLTENAEIVAAAEAWITANPGVIDSAFAAPAAAPVVAAPVVAGLGTPAGF
jgi:hypothetical protein